MDKISIKAIGRTGVRAAVIGAVATVAAVGFVAPAEASTNYWGAIAVGPQSGRVGYSYDYPTQSAAAQAAVTKCGAGDCRAVVRVANGCAALADATNGALGWAAAAALKPAEKSALAHAKGPHPRIVVWVCTTGHQ